MVLYFTLHFKKASLFFFETVGTFQLLYLYLNQAHTKRLDFSSFYYLKPGAIVSNFEGKQLILERARYPQNRIWILVKRILAGISDKLVNNQTYS